MLEMLAQNILPAVVTSSDLTTGMQDNVWDLILNAGPTVKMVLLILFLFSVISWGIIFLKFRVIRSAIKETELFLGIFWETAKLSQIYHEAKKLKNSPLAEIFLSGYMELEKFRKVVANPIQEAGQMSPDMDIISPIMGMGNIRRALEQAMIAERTRLEKNLNFLATTGSTSPFIGLFGTVWGIMDAFRKIGIRGSTNLATVAPGISEALVATAVGLFAAIPAVVAYNYYLGQVKTLSSEMDNFASEFLNIIQRNFEATRKAQQ
jgi:biopolymer transport protein TolQ